jgi:hypothetical protein
MRIQSDQLVSLGYGKYVRSDEVAAVEPIIEGRGPGRRSLVYVRGIAEPLVASRAEGSIVDDLVTPAEEASRMRQQRGALRKIASGLDELSPVLRRVLKEESGVDVSGLIEEAQRALG